MIRGEEPLLDGVIRCFPPPGEVINERLNIITKRVENPIRLFCNSKLPLVALAFKLEECRFGNLTYFCMYYGRLKKGSTVSNMSSGNKVGSACALHSVEQWRTLK